MKRYYMVLSFVIAVSVLTHASDEKTYSISIRDRKIEPANINVRAGESFWLEIKNEDMTTEEFESNSLRIEKFIPPKRAIKIKINRIPEGVHDIFGEFHMATCQGTITAEKSEQ